MLPVVEPVVVEVVEPVVAPVVVVLVLPVVVVAVVPVAVEPVVTLVVGPVLPVVAVAAVEVPAVVDVDVEPVTVAVVDPVEVAVEAVEMLSLTPPPPHPMRPARSAAPPIAHSKFVRTKPASLVVEFIFSKVRGNAAQQRILAQTYIQSSHQSSKVQNFLISAGFEDGSNCIFRGLCKERLVSASAIASRRKVRPKR